MGLAKLSLGRRREALADLDAYLVIEPRDSAALSARAQLHTDLGDLERARRDYELLLEVLPPESEDAPKVRAALDALDD